MRKTIAAIISYNGRKFLPDCIRSCQLAELEILVIDNHSNDGSLDYLSSLNKITLIKNKTNAGFTKATNQAIEYSIKNDFDYLLLLNQDTEFDSGMLPLLMKDFEEIPSLAIVSPLQINESGGLEHQFDLNCKDLGIDFSSVRTQTIEVPFVNAACWLMDLKKVKQIGMLYPIFYNYGSDLNYCNRALHCGFKIAINIKANVIHKKRYRDYQKSLIKTVKMHNTFYLAMVLNPQTNVPIKPIIYALCKGIVANLLKLNFKKALLCKLTLVFLFLRIKEMRKIKKI